MGCEVSIITILPFMVRSASLILIVLLLVIQGAAQMGPGVKITGAMRNVMWKGELQGKVSLDTISNKEHLYGLGPLENLSGELLILDGKSYVSVVEGNGMKVTESYYAKAPFFVYTHNKEWKEMVLPDDIISIEDMETLLDSIAGQYKEPFLFKLEGKVEQAKIHIVNLPPGTKVTSPDIAHQGQQDYLLKNESVILVGFYSTSHQGIFTHHDRVVHIHLITADKNKMGHLDEIKFMPGAVKIYLPLVH